jgi:glycosyltransferase involved in cell wall biosynthesis
LLGVSAAKTFPIHLGLGAEMKRPDADAIAAGRHALRLDRPYLLLVGTLEPRKNIPFLIEVFEKLRDFDGDLVIAGMRGWKFEPILARMAASSCGDRIRHLDYVADEQLPALYAGAEALVFPSLYEGFGFPPLEAMACGTPVVSSRGGSLPEVLGEAAEYVDGFRAEEWAGAVMRILRDRARRAELVSRGQVQARRYTWPETASKTWDVYRQVGR